VSADLLRQAAEKIRVDVHVRYGRGHLAIREATFLRATSRLLDEVAEHVASHDCEAHCELQGCATARAAYVAARAYLGESA